MEKGFRSVKETGLWKGDPPGTSGPSRPQVLFMSVLSNLVTSLDCGPLHCKMAAGAEDAEVMPETEGRSDLL